jgi:hypothetical protein
VSKISRGSVYHTYTYGSRHPLREGKAAIFTLEIVIRTTGVIPITLGATVIVHLFRVNVIAHIFHLLLIITQDRVSLKAFAFPVTPKPPANLAGRLCAKVYHARLLTTIRALTTRKLFFPNRIFCFHTIIKDPQYKKTFVSTILIRVRNRPGLISISLYYLVLSPDV